jgi:hypothetical protein
MKEVRLTRGRVVINFGMKCWRWQRNGNYAVSGVGSFKMHDLILPTTKAGQFVDHIDRNGLNNQKSNLRHCTHSQNCANRRSKNSTGFRGVYSRNNGYEVKIKHQGKMLYLGVYNSIYVAAAAYNQKALELFKEFAILNKL